MSSVCCDERVESVRESLRREDSASRARRSRACWRVERDSEMRATAALSGRILKLEVVWRINCGRVSMGERNGGEGRGQMRMRRGGVRGRGLLRGAFWSWLVCFTGRVVSWLGCWEVWLVLRGVRSWLMLWWIMRRDQIVDCFLVALCCRILKDGGRMWFNCLETLGAQPISQATTGLPSLILSPRLQAWAGGWPASSSGTCCLWKTVQASATAEKVPISPNPPSFNSCHGRRASLSSKLQITYCRPLEPTSRCIYCPP